MFKVYNNKLLLVVIYFTTFSFNYVQADDVASDEKCKLKLQTCAVDTKTFTMEKGDKGELGEMGGVSTSAGNSGPEGLRGWKGEIGDKGSRGPTGVMGPKGFVGPPASCYCQNYADELPYDLLCNKKDTEDDFDPDNFEVKTKKFENFPVKCKIISSGDEESATRVPVYATCLQNSSGTLTEEDLEEISFKYREKPSWLSISEKEKFSIEEFYFGYKPEYLEHLQKHSAYIIQKIKYHCKNALLVPENKNESLQLLSWKDRVIGAESTSLNSFHYEIEDDNCKDSADGWKSANIILKDSNRRLPVLDFRIRDVQKGEAMQQFYFELLELCFYSPERPVEDPGLP
ncbi:hypothetical protein NE865_10947 [Phthorimaea operculella]|nr:hypothetical protein NE865_10947 [Phthorimaea operculella]